MNESILGTPKELSADLREHLELSVQEPCCIAEIALSLVGRADVFKQVSEELSAQGAWKHRILIVKQAVVALRFLAKLEGKHDMFGPQEYEYIEQARDELSQILGRELEAVLTDFKELPKKARRRWTSELLLQIRMLYRGLKNDFFELPPSVVDFWTGHTKRGRTRNLLLGHYP